jgi:hypothetical protein
MFGNVGRLGTSPEPAYFMLVAVPTAPGKAAAVIRPSFPFACDAAAKIY